MNFLQLKTRVSQNVGLAASGADSSEEWTAIGDTVNEAVVDILARTRIFVKCADITLVADQTEYELSQSILRLFNVYHGTIELVEVAPGDIKQTSDPSNCFALVGFNRLVISWIPGPSDLEITAWYTPRPGPMTDDAHDPSSPTYGGIPPEFHEAIVNYASWHMATIAGEGASGLGERYRALYEGPDGMAGPGSNLGRIKKAINRRIANGSRQQRRRRGYDRLTSDVAPGYWQG